jgi:integrase
MKFTKRFLDAVQATGKRQILFDEAMTGLAVRVSEIGKISFYFVYKPGRGADKKWLFIGKYPAMTPELARLKVRELTGSVAAGTDPAVEAQKVKEAQTVSQAIETFLTEHVRQKLKAHTVAQYEGIARRCVIPALGKLKLEEVAHRDLAKLHHQMKDTPYMANRTLAMLSKFFGWCEVNGFRERMTNPAYGLEKYKEKKQMEFMDQAELSAVGSALEALEAEGRVNALYAAALRLVALTGARVSEILSLKWEYIVDLDAGLVHLPDSKTGFKVLHLSTPAIEVLKGVPTQNEFVFPSFEAVCGHVTSLRKVWGLVMGKANLNGRWRIHDLRHAYASAAINSGASLSFVGKLLGHSQASTTARYAHVAENPAHKVAEATGTRIAEALKTKPGSGVIPFQPRKAGGE